MEDAGVRSRRAGAKEGAIMRSTVIICASVLLFAAVGPAAAQYGGVPYSSPGLWTPELANGAIGAGAANNAASPYCANAAVGRDGPRTQCQEAPPAGEGRPRR